MSMPANKAYTLIIVALVVGIILGYIFGLAMAPPAVEQPTTEQPVEQPVEQPPALSGTITVGALLDLSGGLATYGENSKAALELAESEINEWLEAIGADWRIEVRFEDTQVKPAVALSKLQTLAGEGVKFVIGPMSSGEVSEIKSFADENKILVISPSSTSPALAIPNDYIFRFCPTDLFQGPAAIEMVVEAGIEHLVIMWRGDTWGDGLKESMAEAAQEAGITVYEAARYNPEAEEFSSEVAQLASQVQSLVDQYGADKVGVTLISFKEAAAVFAAASEYDVLWQVKWFGSDGTALLSEIVNNPDVAEFAVTVKFLNPIFAPGDSPYNEKLKKYVMDKLDREPDAYAFASYDALWAIALSIQLTQSDDPEVIKDVLPKVVERMVGASGAFSLDENGDRAAADYDLYVPVKEGGQYVWKKAGTWRFTTGTIEWASWWLES